MDTSVGHEQENNDDGIEVLHASVRGRVRVRVPGLYRSPAVRRRIEDALSREGEVRRVNVSDLTATVLVIYAPEVDAEVILERIASILDLPLGSGKDTIEKRTHTTHRLRFPEIAAIFGQVGTWMQSGAVRPKSTNVRPGRGPSHSWHALEPEAVLDIMDVVPTQGLITQEIRTRRERYGTNEFHTDKGRSDFLIFLEQFMTLPVGILGVSAGVSVLTGGVVDAAVILSVVLINAVIGFVTERQAERTILGLSDMRPRNIKVLRNGMVSTVEMTGLVPGDIVLLEPGSYVPADMRLLKAERLTIDESSLTGESMPVEKQAISHLATEIPLGDRRNMAFMGTIATGGTGRGVVIGTGLDTELGMIQSMLETVHPPDTPIEAQLDTLGRQLAILSGVVCGGVFVLGVMRGMSWVEMLKASTSLAVAAVPEGLPAVATSTLALGIKQMRSHNVAIRRLPAVETLGSVQNFCFDKTGTLTQNRMQVVEVVQGMDRLTLAEGRVELDDADTTLSRLLEVIVLCNEADAGAEGRYIGSATEIALLDLAVRSGIELQSLRDGYPMEELRPRAEGRPLMSSLHRMPDGRQLLAVKGSPAEVLERCDYFMDGETVLDEVARQRVFQLNEQMATDALRVLGVAYREMDDGDAGHSERLIWLGLVGMTDPLRPGMAELMQQFHQAGIKTVMITGDQSATAHAVARELRLSDGKPEQILDAINLDQMDPEILRGLAPDIHVFSRVSPAHKLRIVQAYQQAGRVVAMTGDGINDAPALKAADDGVAMGQSGTDVARSVADVVLEDDNLQTMLVAVEQGRTIYENIRKTVHFLISTNLTEIEIMVISIALGMGQPLNAMQLLWINLLSDIFPGLALSQEPPEEDVMRRPPRDPKETILPAEDLAHMGVESLTITGVALVGYLYAISRYGVGPRASTVAFNTLTTSELLHAISCRSRTHSFYHDKSLPRNPYLELALGGSVLAQVAANLVPGLRTLLGMTPMSRVDTLVVLAGSGLPLLINEALKGVRYLGKTSGNDEGASKP